MIEMLRRDSNDGPRGEGEIPSLLPPDAKIPHEGYYLYQ
jgi:hypothetical protein